MAKQVYDPIAKTREYKDLTEKRGYSHFSLKAQEVQREKNAGYDRHKLLDIAQKQTDTFLDIVNDPHHQDHLKTRAEFYDKYLGDPKNVKNALYKELCDMTGFAELPQSNTGYEQKVLKPKSINPTRNQAATHAVFRDLIRSKWNWNGYLNDDKVIKEFEDEYGNIASSSDEDEDRGARNMANLMNEKHSATEKK